MARAIAWVVLVAILVMYINTPSPMQPADGGVMIQPIQRTRELIVVPQPAYFGPRRTFDDVMADVLERR